jgi:hypothetical protein
MGCGERGQGSRKAAVRGRCLKIPIVYSHKIYYMYFIFHNFDREGPRGADVYI